MKPRHLEHDWFSRPLPDNVSLGERAWLHSTYAFAHYKSAAPIGVRIGKDTGLYLGTFFDVGPEAEIRIGDFCSLVSVIFATNGRVTIGDYTFIAHEVVIADGAWPLPGRGAAQLQQRDAASTIEIGNNVWIGAQAVLVGNLQIGDGAIIGAGALVTRDVPASSVCVGNPMKISRMQGAG